jgi:diguanylate cyclase (GGDEF)-like protein
VAITAQITDPLPAEHPRTVGWVGASALAVGGSNQSLFLIGALIVSQGTGAVPLLVVGLILSWMALPGWTELVLMWPNRVGGISATCAEAFRPYSPVLANLTGVSYWWGWVPTCGLTAILSASALHQWYLPGVAVEPLAIGIILVFLAVNLCGIRWVTRMAKPIALGSVVLALGSAIIPVLAGTVDWSQAGSFHLDTPFSGTFGVITSAMAGLYLIGFAAPAFEAAACHVGEMRDPVRNLPRAMFASAGLASVYFLVLPVVWLGVLGPSGLEGDLTRTLGPTFAPLLGVAAKSAAIGFMVLNMFHGTLQPLAGASRTLSQLSEDGLLPRILAWRNRVDVPWFATVLTASTAIVFLLLGDPVWLIAAANFCYLIAIGLPSVAVWLLRRDDPDRERPYRAPRGTVLLGVAAAAVWGLSTVLGFQQFGLPTVLVGLALAYSGSLAYAWRKRSDRRRSGERGVRHSLQAKLAGAMIAVMTLDGGGYLLAVSHVDKTQTELVSVLADIFVAVAMLTVVVGLVLPGIISHSTEQVAKGADRLARGTLFDFTQAMQALSEGRLDEAHARVELEPVHVRGRDEVGAMADSFNLMQEEVGRAAVALDGAREGLRASQATLNRSIGRQVAIADLGRSALEGGELTGLMDKVARTVASVLEVEIVAVLEQTGDQLRVRGAKGLAPHRRLALHSAPAALGADADSPEGHPLLDLSGAGDAGGEAMVPVRGRREEPFGALCCQTRLNRSFSEAEFAFLAAVANVLADAIARRRSEDEIRHQALHDPLTGLPNRSLFIDRLRLALAHGSRRESSVAVLFLDFDHFKLINDSLGHATGDDLLNLVAARLDSRLRAGDTLARFGGDEFVMICDDLAGADEARTIAKNLAEVLQVPFRASGSTELTMRASIGIAISSGTDADAENLIAEADAAMYRAKEQGGGRIETFDEVMRGDATSQLRLENDLARALDNGQFRLDYQPIVALETGQLLGVEALVRWRHPELGLVSPAEFIPIAEANGMIVPLGEWVLREACMQAASWRQGRPPGTGPTVAVNLSLRQLAEAGLPAMVGAALSDAALDPAALHLEVTESAVMQHAETAVDTLTALKELGVAIHLDDFGTGYSSLSHLRRFPIDALKIDRSFVAAVTDNDDDETIVAAIISMATSLDVEVVAEGIETPEQSELLQALGCRMAQGFFYSRPTDAETITALLDRSLPGANLSFTAVR